MIRLQVEWTDSGTFHQDGWEKREDIVRKTRIGTVTSIGFFFAETEDTLYLALSYDADHDTYLGVQAVQKSSIVKKVVLRER
jgi:hypothetical protein